MLRLESLDVERTRQHIRQAVEMFGGTVERELSIIETVPDVERARIALVFAMISPRCPFERNVRATPVILDAILRRASRHTLETILRKHGIGLAPTKAMRLWFAGDYVRDMRYPPDRDLILALRGAGMKVSAMAIALYRADAPVMTLDSHMLRGIGIARESLHAGTYARIERWLINLAREEYPDMSPFAVQWCLWNLYGFGYHVSHLAIFGVNGRNDL